MTVLQNIFLKAEATFVLSNKFQIFHDVAYHAHNREDLLAGIDEFLDQVTVLPPGEWDPSIRIEPPKSVPSQVSPSASVSSHPQLYPYKAHQQPY